MFAVLWNRRRGTHLNIPGRQIDVNTSSAGQATPRGEEGSAMKRTPGSLVAEMSAYLAIIGLGAVVSTTVVDSWVPGVAIGVMIATAVVATLRVIRRPTRAGRDSSRPER